MSVGFRRRRSPPATTEAANTIENSLIPGKIIDLTQPLGPATALWPGSSPFGATAVATTADDGWFARDLRVPEHAGTHLDAPAHFVEGAATVADIPIEALVRPCVVIDVAAQVGDDATFTLDAGAIVDIERRDGAIPRGSCVLVRTGWDRHIADRARYIGLERPSCPGIGVDAARLVVERGAVGIGIDTLGIDPGHAHDCPAHAVTLGAGLWHVEGLVGLDRLPPRGAWVVVGVVKLVAGSGAPARVVALLPG